MVQSLNLEDCRDVFEYDGGLRDLYVAAANLEDWQHFMIFSAKYPREFFIEQEPLEIPDRIWQILADSQNSYLMRLMVGGLSIHCHFYCEEEIELDIDPVEVTTQERFTALTDFICDLGKALGKDVTLTGENRISQELLGYVYDEDKLWCGHRDSNPDSTKAEGF